MVELEQVSASWEAQAQTILALATWRPRILSNINMAVHLVV